MEDLIQRLRKRAVVDKEGKPDRIAEILTEAADALTEAREVAIERCAEEAAMDATLGGDVSSDYSKRVRFHADLDATEELKRCEGHWRFENSVSRAVWQVNGEVRVSVDMAEYRAMASHARSQALEEAAKAAKDIGPPFAGTRIAYAIRALKDEQ